MSADAQVIRVVVSWACGFFALALLGIAIPMLLSFLPDAVHLWRRRGEMRPTVVVAGLAVGLTVLTGYEATYTGIPGTPSTTLWISLALLLGIAVGVAGIGLALSRALRRGRDRRTALQAATEPPASRSSSPAGGGAPVAVQRLTARGAEFLACDWMQHLGAAEAVVTPQRRDGGVDVRSREFIAQVKHLTAEQVGVAAVRQLYGVAAAEQRRALFFSSSGYTRDALAFARENDVALFVVRYQQGRLVPHGALAQQYLTHGLHPLARA